MRSTGSEERNAEEGFVFQYMVSGVDWSQAKVPLRSDHIRRSFTVVLCAGRGAKLGREKKGGQASVGNSPEE